MPAAKKNAKKNTSPAKRHNQSERKGNPTEGTREGVERDARKGNPAADDPTAAAQTEKKK
jgi:hypothetical protein